jgi:murein DD-endopeptidase MepM/ murein hydrolase activator NlpD
MIIPAAEGEANQRSRFSIAEGESLLERAVRLNTDEWTLTDFNGLSDSWKVLPGDTLYSIGGNGDQSTSGLPSAFISAEIRDLPLKQGGTGVIKVKTNEGVSLGGTLVDHPLHFFAEGDEIQVALQGIHRLIDPGVYPIRIDATLGDGTVQSFEQTVLVVSGNYPEEPPLVVAPEFIDPAVTGPELDYLVSITSSVTPDKLWLGQFTSPASLYAESTYFTSRYGFIRTYIGSGTDLEISGWHTGLDFGGGVGLPITAPAAGKVVFASPLTVRGNATIIDHGWGVFSGFWHQSKFNVQVGDMVEQGQVIGEVGGTGRVTGAHLHWELWVNGVQVDPLDWLEQVYP